MNTSLYTIVTKEQGFNTWQPQFSGTRKECLEEFNEYTKAKGFDSRMIIKCENDTMKALHEAIANLNK